DPPFAGGRGFAAALGAARGVFVRVLPQAAQHGRGRFRSGQVDAPAGRCRARLRRPPLPALPPARDPRAVPARLPGSAHVRGNQAAHRSPRALPQPDVGSLPAGQRRMSAQRRATIAEAWAGPRNNFNLMRLFAAWLVIYGHAWAITGSPGGDLVAWLTQFKFAGGVAVDVFFVVSGFLIAASLQRNDVRGYLVSRALRILPALVACVALAVLVLGPLLTTSPQYWRDPATWDYLWVNGSLWSSRYFLPGVFDTLPNPAVNGSLWTLP